jgi:thiol-disulfide isomerase/thioredoxin
MNTQTLIIALAVLIIVGGGVYYASMEPAEVAKERAQDVVGQVSMDQGVYRAYDESLLAAAETGDVVLFFRASWCPTCRSLDQDLRGKASVIPKGLTILDVNYDSATALKQKYGVTHQHTLVQVRADGTQITKWSGSPTLADILTHLQ